MTFLALRPLVVGASLSAGFFLLAQSSAQAASCINAPSGLVAFWPGDSTTTDLIGTNHGVLVNTAAYGTGKVASAFQLNGVNGYVQSTDSPLWAFGTNNFTIELWANFAATSGSRALVASDAGGGGNNKWIFWLDAGVLKFHINGSPGSVNIGTAAFSPATNQWYHLALTRNTTNYTFYIDGVAAVTNSDSRPVPDANAPLTIGQAEGAFYFNGLLDEVSIYNRSLTGTEIQAIRAADDGGKCRDGLLTRAATVPYFTDFETGIGAEWSASAVDASESSPFTIFFGRFGNSLQSLTLTNLTPGQSYTVGFDLYPLDSWDGTSGADYLNVHVNGLQVFHHTFWNFGLTQTFPGQPDEGRANLGFNASYPDSIYRNIEVTFFASNTVATIGFSGQNLSGIDDESWGIDNVSVKLTSDLTTTTIRSATLPVHGSTNSIAINVFTIAASRPLLAATAGNAANFTLREAGLNNTLGDGDDVVYTLTPSFTAGRAVSFTFANSPLQPGRYRFQTTSGLQDTNATAVALFTRDFTIAHPPLGRIENTANDTLIAATPLPTTESPAASGFFTAFGVGALSSTSDVDYWRFDGEAGDRITVRLEAELPGTNPQLQLRNSSDQNLQNISGTYEGIAGFQNYILPAPGTYYLRTFSNNRSSRYGLRVDQSRAPQMESEANDTQVTANVINLTVTPGLYQGRIAGSLPGDDPAGDCFRLGILNIGNAITINALFPTGSSLSGNQTLLSVQIEGNTNALATSTNGTLNYNVTNDAVHFVRIETPNRQLRAQYLLNFTASDGVPPVITSATLPGEGAITTNIIDRFTLTFSEEIVGSSISNSANYELRGAGGDGSFNTSDDTLYTVLSAGYAGGLSSPHALLDGPLQPGNYRFKARTNLIDRGSNPMAAEFIRHFAVTNVPGFVLENRGNNVGGLATSFSLNPGTNGDGTISFHGSTGVGSRPQAIATGLINSDTNLDLVTANVNSGNLSVLLGNGRGGFQWHTNIATGAGAVGLALGDFNNDAKLDAAVANIYANTVSLMLGDGAGNFQLFSNYTGFNQPYYLAAADLNGDNKLDLVVPNYGGGNVTVRLGNGDGTFAPATNYATASQPLTVAIGHLTADPNLDVVVANANNNTVSFLRGNGDGSFQSATNLAVGRTPRSVAIGDVTGEGTNDVVVLDAGDNTISILRGNGDGTFQPRQDFSTATSDAYQVLLTDLNSDNRNDVVVPGYGNNILAVLLNNGSGSFTNLHTYGVSGNPIGVTAGDYNGDGRRDLAFAVYNSDAVNVWLGNRVSLLAENPPASGMSSAFARGNLSAGDVDYFQFSGTAGDLLVLAVDVPGNPTASSLTYRIERPDGSGLVQFTSAGTGWDQSAPLTLPQSGTYLVRVTANNDYQSEYRLRVTTVRPPTQFETEGNDSIATANSFTLAPTNGHQVARAAGYISFGDANGDYFRLGNLGGGATINLGVQKPSSSGLAGIIGVYNAAGIAMTSSVPGAASLVFTVPNGLDGVYYARMTAGEIGHGGGPGYTLRLDGVDDHINIPNFGNTVPNSEVTVEFWQYVAATKGQFTFVLNPDNTGNRFSAHVPWSDGTVYWDFGNYSVNGRLSYVPPSSIVNSWQHFALVSSQSGNFMRIYRNGVLEASKSGASAFTSGSAALRIGGLAGNMFGGVIDDFRVWNVVRSQTEIQQNMNVHLTGAETGLVGYWPFDEGSGTNTSDTTVFANHGTLVSGASWETDGTTVAQPYGLFAQYLLNIDLLESQPPLITGDTLPAEGTSVTTIIDRLSVGFNKDVATNFNALNRVVLTNGGHSYMLTDIPGTWQQAEAQAQALGAHLVTINNAAENAWVNTYFSLGADVWIGLNDQVLEGTYAWASGEPFGYISWQASQPDNSNNEDFGEMFGNGRWNDRGNRIQLGVIEVSSNTDTDADRLVDNLDPFPADPLNAFDLRAAGVDTLFDTPDDLIYNLDTTGYTGGTNAAFVIVDGPLQPGNYRFKVTSSLRDRYGNALAAPYVRSFTILPVPGYVIENRSNNVALAASSFSTAPTNRPDGSLTMGDTVAVGANPIFIVSGRFNGDTNLDLVTANFSGDTISVLTGSSNGTFQLVTNIGTGDGSICIAVGDFNTDSNLDLAVANYNAGTVSVLVGNGAGGFQILSNYSGFNSPRNLATGDFNNDGKLDLAVPNEGNATVRVLLGSGNGTFGTPVGYSVGANPWTVAVGDVNNDGKLDLAVANQNSGNVSLLLGNGDGSFQSALNTPSGPMPRFLALGRMNSGDTNLDLVVLNAGDNTASVLSGNGDGSFQPRVNYALGSSDPYQVILTDLDLDGALDVVVASYGNNRLVTLLNKGDGTLADAHGYAMSGNPISVVSGDFNADGRPDLATANYGGNSVTVEFGNLTQLLALDAGSGFRLGAGRGNLSDNGDVDYWSFTARANDRLLVASETPGDLPSSGLCYQIYRPEGGALVSFCSDANGRGQVGAVLPVSGTYSLRVTYNYGYYGEYRLRVVLAPPPAQIETESNDSVGQADVPVLALSAGHQTATMLGGISTADGAGDFFRLGNLAVGSTISLGLVKPADGTISGVLGVYNAAGALMTNSAPGAGSLAYSVAGEAAYFARVTASSGAGIRGQYLLGIDLADTLPPTITGTSLPGEGTTISNILDRFSLNFSEDMIATSVTSAGSYELRHAGGDGNFGNGDDEFYGVVTSPAYVTGLSASYQVTDGPLQSGKYRFTARTNLLDRASNPLAAAFVRNFTITNVSGFVLENRSNDVALAASSFSPGPTNWPDGSLTMAGSIGVGSNPYFIVAGRFNGDTNVDLVTANLGGDGVSVLSGNGNGTFQLVTNIGTGDGAISMAMGDFNTDSNLDLAVANYYVGTVSVLAGNGAGGFVVLSNYSGFNSPRNLATADFNNDGKLDLAVPNEGNGTVRVLLGSGSGSFGTAVGYGVGANPWTVAVGDVNNDGKLDLTVANANSDNLSLLLGNGDGSFQSSLSIPAGSAPRSVVLGRMNAGDTNLDLVVLNASDNAVSVLLGNGNGSFQSRVNYGFGSSDSYQLILTDVDLDGALDVAVASYGGNRLVVLPNRGDGTLGNLQSYGASGNPISVAAGDFNGDGRPDLATANHLGHSVSVHLGNRTQLLPADAGSGLRLGMARGNLSDNGDADFWSFSARVNDRLLVTSETPGDLPSSGLCYQIYRPDGGTLTSFCSDANGRGQVGAVLPVSGTYSIRVTVNYGYYGEYRLRVALAPPPAQIETESNDSVGQADTPVLALNAGHQTATILGGITTADGSGDFFRLGNLAPGAGVNLSYKRPGDGTLIAVLGIYNSSGQLVTAASPGVTNLSTLVASNDTYYARLTAASNSAGLFAQYLLNTDLADTASPFVTSVTLPAASTTNLTLIDRFTLNFSKDLDPAINLLNRQVLLYGGHAYLISDASSTWFDAENQARSFGGHLATINDVAENSWVRDNFNGYGSVWIGLTDEAQEGNFIWASGEPFSYTNWTPGEPNNSGNEDYAALLTSGRWNDESVSTSHRGVIEVAGTDTDGDGLPDTLDPYPADALNGFDLRAAGTDGLFDTSDDQVYRLTFPTYNNGLALNFTIADGPLQPGNYRFRATSSLRDRFGNSLGPVFDRFFVVNTISDYIVENRGNNSSGNATPLALAEDPPGLKIGGGRGSLFDNGDADFWSFNGAAGDRFLLVTEVPGNPAASQLHYELFQPNGTPILDFYPEYTGGGQSPAVTLPTNGTYTVRVTVNYGYHGEYRLRVLTATAPLQAENEDNGSLGTATAITLAASGDTRFGSIAGVVRTAADLDYINLGTITNGTTIFLNTRLPAGSTLTPVVSVYNAANVYQSEAPGGRSTDGVAEVPITANGNYYALVRSGEGTGDPVASYLLDVQVVPTGTVSFPNLQVVTINLPTGGGIQSGQQVTHSFVVQNIGSLATPGANWLDRAAMSLNTTLGDGDDIPLGLLGHNGALNSSDSYTVTNTVTLPDGISGDYYIIVQTDAGNAVNEFVFEADNTTVSGSTFHISLAPYPDLKVEALTLAGPDGNNVYTATWNTANRGNAPAAAGFEERFIVRNLTSGAVPVNSEQTISNSFAINATAPRLRTFSVTNAGNYRVEVTVDSQNDLFEFDATSHASAELNTATTNFSITQLYNVTVQSSPPGAAALTGAGSFQSGSIVTVTAQPITNVLPYLFVNWTEGASFLSANTNYTFVLTRDRALVANLTLPSFLLSASNNPPAGGSVIGQGTFFYGTTNVLTANANFGYKFTNWTENGAVISLSPSLATVVTSNRFVVANFVEANTFHVVTTATSPTNLAVLTGSGTYSNGQSFAFSAPASVTNPPNIYNFHEWRGNGSFISGNAAFNKTFSTLDPTNLQFVAHYDAVSILPLITNVTINSAQPVPATTNFQLSVQFNRTMNTNFTPLIVLSNAAPGSTQPVVPAGGTWNTVAVANDTFTPPPITLSAGMDGTNNVIVSLARDLGGSQLALTNVLPIRVDVTPPSNPTLSLTASNSSSATLSWSGYAAPADLSGFRVFLATSNFTSVAGRVPVSAVGAGTRAFTYGGLALDQPYFAAVAAVDVAGNSTPGVTPLAFTLPSSTPPPVQVQVQAVGPASANVSWNSYDTTYLLGFAGFKLYYETTNFSSVSNLTPKQTLGPGERSLQIDNLDRTRVYHFAVVGFNGNNAFNSNVTTAAWSDPLAGNIGVNMVVGGSGQTVDILQNINLVSNAVFTIPAGSTIRFAPGTGLTVQQGALNANGTALDPIVFTSANDQPGFTPAAGDWAGVTLGSGAGASVLRHVFIKYSASLTLSNSAPTVDAFTALYNTGAGLNLLGTATLTTSNALLAFNGLGAFQFNSAQLNIRNSVLKNNGTNAQAAGSASLTATQNWWGSAISGDVDATVQGSVVRSNFLVSEPLLTPAVGTSNNITQTGSRNVNLRLACRTAEAMRLSEDSAFTGVFFTPFTNAAPFQLSDGGGVKTVFAQFRSITGQTSAPVNVTITYITAGPTISALSLSEGQVLNRPLVVTGSATAPLGMATMEFYVDNVGLGTNAGGSFSQWFDVRNFSAAVHRVKLLARDTAGNFATLERNVVIAPVPPPAPTITDPPADIAVNTNTLRVAGTAEAFVEIRLFRSGTILGVTNASSAGTFGFSGVPLVEGVNSLSAVAIDSLGSAGSPVRTVLRDTVPPAALILDPPVYTYGIGLTLSWHFPPTGKRANSFEVFWHTSPITNTNQASGHSLRTPGTHVIVQGLATANYYFYIVGYDDIGNASPLSAPVQFLYDAVPPAFTVAFDKPSPVGVGPVRVTLTSSKPVNGVPSTTVQPNGSAPALLTLTNTGLNTFEGTINVTPLLPSGPVALNIAAQDTAGNPFNGSPSGAALSIDVRAPSGAISTAPLPPVQATNDLAVAVNLRLTEAPKIGTVPTVNFGPPAGASVPVTMSGSGTNWNGILTITPAMGSGIGNFTLTVNDALDNVGHSITAGSALEIYNTGLPSPPGQPVGFQVTSLSGGRVHLNWLAVSNAEMYRVYSAAGTNLVAPTTLVADNISSNSYIDLPPADGFHRYVVTASRRGSEGTNSIVRVALSDRTPPSAPTNVVLQLVAAGLQVGWQAGPAPAPDHYTIYRNGTPIRTVGGGTTTMIDTPPRGVMNYTVAAADALGNEALSAPAVIQLLVGSVDNLTALVNVGAAPMVSWVSSDPTVVGFNVYRNGIKQNAGPLAGTNFTDLLPPAGPVVTYAVRALNATNAESAARTVNVYAVDLALLMNPSVSSSNPPTGRYFDNYRVSASNLTVAGALPLRQIEVRRTSKAGPFDLTSVVGSSIGAGSGLVRDLAVPCATDNSPQVVRLRAVQETDAGGSSVIYQRTFDFPTVQAPGVMMEVSANTLPLAGGLNSFEVRIFNRGYTTMYLATTRGNGADPGDLYILVRNPQGQKVSSQPFTGSLPGIIFSGGVGYVPMAPGTSLRLTVPNVLVPEALASNLVTFEAVVSAIYDRFSLDGQQTSGPLSGSMQSSLAQTPYYGTAQTDFPLYSNDQPILITGQALDRLTGLPRANVALRIGFATRGYRWYRDVTTDANGNYSYTYNPGPGLAGSLTIWAAHPDVVDQLNQAQVTIYRIYAAPPAGDIRMSKNDTLGFSIELLNPGDQALTNFTVGFSAYTMVGTNQVATTKVHGSLLVGTNFSVAAGKRERINLQLAADADAPDNAVAVFTFTSGEGAAAVFTGNVTLLAAVPIISVVNPAVGYVEVSLDRGSLLSRPVTIANRGLKDLQGVTLVPPTNETWMVLNLPANPDGSIPLPDLKVGESNSFTVVFAPPANTSLGFHQDRIIVRGTNSPGTFDVNLYARITSSQKGAVQFWVDNILGFDVPNATVRLRNTSLQVELPPVYTDINGLVTVTNLQEGDWSWQVNAPGHSANVGVVQVIPSQTVQVASRLNKSVVTVNFSVVPVPFTDRYEIRLEQTFETHVPLPVLVLTPAYMEFNNVAPGFEASYIVTAKNEGLIQMDNLTIRGSHSASATFEPLITYVPVLLPQQTIEIPFHVTYSGTNAPSQQSNPLVDCLPNPLGFMDDLIPFAEGLAALANAEGRCVRDNSALLIAGTVAMTLRIIGDVTSVLASIPEQIASYVGCVIGSLLANFGGFGGGGGGGGGGQQSVQNFAQAGDGCFAAETRVLLADGRFKTIAEIKPGDVVRTGTRLTDVAHVVETLERTATTGRLVEFAWPGTDKTDSLRTTDEHLFWVDGRGWVEARVLRAGDWLLDDAARPVRITKSERIEGSLQVFTFRLREDPAFYANGILVHDMCGFWSPEGPVAGVPARGPPAAKPVPQKSMK